jgi:hypothetical protein
MDHLSHREAGKLLYLWLDQFSSLLTIRGETMSHLHGPTYFAVEAVPSIKPIATSFASKVMIESCDAAAVLDRYLGTFLIC